MCVPGQGRGLVKRAVLVRSVACRIDIQARLACMVNKSCYCKHQVWLLAGRESRPAVGANRILRWKRY